MAAINKRWTWTPQDEDEEKKTKKKKKMMMIFSITTFALYICVWMLTLLLLWWQWRGENSSSFSFSPPFHCNSSSVVILRVNFIFTYAYILWMRTKRSIFYISNDDVSWKLGEDWGWCSLWIHSFSSAIVCELELKFIRKKASLFYCQLPFFYIHTYVEWLADV